MYPQMQPQEIAVIEKILLSFKHSVDVLEWGSGGSTVYFTEFLQKHGADYTWLSLEYNKEWYEKVFHAVKDDSRTSLVLFDVGNTKLKQNDLPMNEYVNYPRALGKKYDFILVDGRKRRRCLLEARQLLKPGGRVILHDARRTYYHSAFVSFPDRQILLFSGLWQGRLEAPRFARRLYNILRYIIFRIYTFSFRFLPTQK